METSIKHKKSIVSDDENDLNGILNLWKRFTLKGNSPSTVAYQHLFHPHHQVESMKKSKNLTIYLKAPYALSGGTMEGTIVMSPAPKKKIQQIELNLHGIEIVFDPAHYSTSTHAHHFLNLPILTLQQPNNHLNSLQDTIVIPFRFQMPLDLGSTFKDKKGCVQYTLQCHARTQKEEDIEESEEIWFTDRPLHVYQNYQAPNSATDQTSLYHPINEQRRIWERRRSSISSSPNNKEASHVDVQMNLPRSIWTSGSSLYVNMKMENKSMHKMRDVKLDLIKRQNTYWQTGLHKSFDLMPVTSTCELIASTSLLNLGWWQALDPQSNDHVMIPLEIPAHEFTIKNQKLIDVSFALRISITSLTSTDAIIEIPITLVHPISSDPPPGTVFSATPVKNNYIKSLPCSPSLPIFERNYQYKPTEDQTLALPYPSSTGSSSVWSSVSLTYTPFMPITTDSASPPPPPLPPKQQYQFESKSPSIKNSDNDGTTFTDFSPVEELTPFSTYEDSSSSNEYQDRIQTSASTLKSEEIRMHHKVDSYMKVATRRKKITVVDACEALMHHTADKCKSALFSSSWSSAIFSIKKKPLVQKLSSSFSSGVKSSSNATIHHHSKQARLAKPSENNMISPSETMFVVAPSQKFEISVQELDLLCHSPSSYTPSSPQYPPPLRSQHRHHKSLSRLWSLKRKRKSRRSQGVKGTLD